MGGGYRETHFGDMEKALAYGQLSDNGRGWLRREYVLTLEADEQRLDVIKEVRPWSRV